MRLARLEQLRRSPHRSPKRRPIKPFGAPPKNGGGTPRRGAKRKLEVGENLQKRERASSGATPPTEGDGKPRSSSDASSDTDTAATPDTDTAATDDDSDWKDIDRAETLVFRFRESEDPSSVLPYSLEVVWTHEDREYVTADDAGCGEEFVPLIEGAARRAKSLTSFVVRYNNRLDRTWPYTKVLRIAEVVSEALRKEAVLESVDGDRFEYVVNLVAGTNPNERKPGSSGSSFVGKVDFSCMDIMRKYYVLDYIGDDTIDFM